MKTGVWVVLMSGILAGGAMTAAYSEENVRHPVVSGQFYPGSAGELRRDIQGYLKQAAAKADPQIRAIVVPHAGYPYSGPVAAEAYKAVQGGNYDSVIVIAFSHRTPFSGVFVDTPDFYETPLGRVPVDKALAEEIRQFSPVLQDKPRGVFEEHSLEVQVPFLQEVLGNLKIVPIYMGNQTVENAKILADAVAKPIKGKRVLVVFSTDLSHYHPYDTAVQMDHKLISIFEKGNVLELARDSDSGQVEACGLGPLMSALLIGEQAGWGKPELVRYANSGDVTGTRGKVVGYAALKMKKV